MLDIHGSFCDIQQMKSSSPLSFLPEVFYAKRERHLHTDYFWDNRTRRAEGGLVLQRTLSGSAGFYPDPNSPRIIEVGKNRAMLFRHGEATRYGLHPAARLPYHCEYLVFTPDGGAGELFDGIREQFGPVIPLDPEGPPARFMQGFVEDQRAPRPPDRIARAERLYLLLLSLQRELSRETRAHDPVAYGKHLLETQFRSPANLKEWCAQLDMSREHFTRVFHQRYGQTPAAYLRRLRLRHARSLLFTGNMNLTDLAAASGFASVQTFTRAYRNTYGTSPGQDRSAVTSKRA